MRVERVDMRLVGDGSGEGVLAYADIVLAGEEARLLVRELRIVRIPGGMVIVGMPSKQVRRKCESCQMKCPAASSWCPWCGARQEGKPSRMYPETPHGGRLYFDVLYPMSLESRDWLDAPIMKAYEEARAAQASQAGGEATDGDAGHATPRG